MASLLDPSLYEKTIEIVAEDEGIDMILVISTPVPECLDYVAEAARAIDKPLAVSVYALPESEPEIYRSLSERGVAAYPDPKTGGVRARPHGGVLEVSRGRSTSPGG